MDNTTLRHHLSTLCPVAQIKSAPYPGEVAGIRSGQKIHSSLEPLESLPLRRGHRCSDLSVGLFHFEKLSLEGSYWDYFNPE